MTLFTKPIRLLFKTIALAALSAMLNLEEANAQCTIANTNASNTNSLGAIDAGQSFNAACSGLLSSIELQFLNTFSSTGLVIEIYQNATVSGTPLGTVSGLSYSGSGLGNWQSFDLSSANVNLTSGVTYTILIKNSANMFYDQSSSDAFTSGSLYAVGAFQNNLDLLFRVGISAASPCSMTASITSQTNVSCNGSSDGSLTVTASGGAANYSYNWAGASNTSGSASATNTVSSLSAATYTVTITDNNSCTATASGTITEPLTLTGGSISH